MKSARGSSIGRPIAETKFIGRSLDPTKPSRSSRRNAVAFNKVGHGGKKSAHSNHNNTSKSWGQQCSVNCGCVLRFEARVDHMQRIVDCNYVAKSVVTTIDKDNGGRLTPVYTTRMKRPMFQECKCKSVHALAESVTSYLPNKRWNNIKDMNDFVFTRSSLAFRHAVLAEHDLPRTDTHCFDVMEEAFTAMMNAKVPSKRRINAPFEKVLAAECLQRPVLVHYSRSEQSYVEEAHITSHQPHERFDIGDSADRRLGVDRNRVSMSTSKTMNTLEMFDINAENWLDEENHEREEDKLKTMNTDELDWVTYVDELQMFDASSL